MKPYFISCPFCGDLCMEMRVYSKLKGRIELAYKCQSDNCNAIILCSRVKA